MTYISFINPPNDTIWNNEYSLFEPYQKGSDIDGLMLLAEPLERLDSLSMKINDSINLNVENKFIFFLFYKTVKGDTIEKIEKYRISNMINKIEKLFSFVYNKDNFYFVIVDQIKLNIYNEYEDELKKIALELDEKGYLQDSYYRDKYNLNHIFISNDFDEIEQIWNMADFEDSFNKELINKLKEEIINKLTNLFNDKKQFFSEIGEQNNFLNQILNDFRNDFEQNIKMAMYKENKEQLQKISPKKIILENIAKYYSAINRYRQYPIIYYRRDNKNIYRFYTDILSLANLLYFDIDRVFKEKSYWLFIENIKLINQNETYNRFYTYLNFQYENLQTLYDSSVEVELYNQGDKEIKFEHPVKLENIKEFLIPYFYTEKKKQELEENIEENNRIIDDNRHIVNKYVENEYKKFKNNFSSTQKTKEILKQEDLENRLLDLSREREKLRDKIQQREYKINYLNVEDEFNKINIYFDRLTRLSNLISVTIYSMFFILISFGIGFMTKTSIMPNLTYGLLSLLLIFILVSFIVILKLRNDCKMAYRNYYQKIKNIYNDTINELSNRIKIAKFIMKSRYVNYDYYLIKDKLENLKLNLKKYQFHIDEIFRKKEYIEKKNKEHIITLDRNFSIATIEHYPNIDTDKGVINNRTYALFAFNEDNISKIDLSGKEVKIKNSSFINVLEIKTIKKI